MPQWLQWALIVAGIIASALLARFIVRQLRAVQEDTRRRQKTESFQKQRRDNMVESLRVLSMAIEADQVEYSEACLRIKGLLDHVEPSLLQRAPFDIFQTVHDKIQHMPTHQARQETETKFVEKMDEERAAVEEEHADAIRRAATALKEHAF